MLGRSDGAVCDSVVEAFAVGVGNINGFAIENAGAVEEGGAERYLRWGAERLRGLEWLDQKALQLGCPIGWAALMRKVFVLTVVKSCVY